MQALGQQFTGRQVYYFYRALRVVALKRTKGRKPGRSGMAASGLQAAQLCPELHKEQLVQEYAQGLGRNIHPTMDVYSDAINCVYTTVLKDRSPPWLLHSCPRALPGIGVWSKYTRPCFLTWGADVVRSVLGPSVLGEFANAMSAVGLPLSCGVARPMYVCTGRISGGMCMAMASMSRVLQGKHARGE